MFGRQSTVPWCLKFIPISCMGPKHAPKDRDLSFNQFICTGACACSSNYAFKTQLMHKMSKRTLKNQKNSHTTPVVLCWHEKIRGNGYRFILKGGTFPTKNHHASCEKLRFVRSIYPNLPQMGQNLYHGMLIPIHDSMPSLVNFFWI